MYGIRGFRLGTSPETFPTSAVNCMYCVNCAEKELYAMIHAMGASRDFVPLGVQLK